MIVVELNGGLGNQLFQYAAGLSLAHHHGVELKINPASFATADSVTGTTRKLELHHFSDAPAIATAEEISSLLDQSPILRAKEKLLPFHRRYIYKEKSVTFDTSFFRAGKHVYLKGNRQSEKYFKPYESYIKQKLRLNYDSIARVSDLGDRVSTEESVALHIRRGDYLTNIALDVLGLVPVEHYQSAYAYLSSRKKIDHAYIFSDDIQWVRKHLELPVDTTYVSGNISNSSIEDFYLISQCKHQVIANSTFSWWAAWLNPNPGKIVVAPKKWFNNAPYDTRDLIPESWIKI